ncbi:tRNA threonylcarbamoyladenosine biosynthesis protein TsaB [compost metagenome]
MLLAINTATSHLSVALLEDGLVLAEASQRVGAEHSEVIFRLLESLFAWVDRPRTDLQAVGVSTGPGGFTGLRTGIALAKTVAQALDIPVYGVDTLAALAYQVPGPHVVSAMLDGRLGKVFAALYRVEGNRLVELEPGRLAPLDDWLAVLEAHDGPMAMVGEGATTYRDRLDNPAKGWWVPPDAHMAAGAMAVGLLAAQKLDAGTPSELATLAPVYHREPQAVVNWEAAQRAKQEDA